jgi:hypothetical protein
MANDRLIRGGILTSDKINALSWACECFYRRVLSLVDDYGNYDGRLEIIRSNAYPLKLNQVSTADIAKWLDESVSAGLISCYEVVDKSYLHLHDFNQRLKKYKRKFPPYPDEEKRREEETETEEKGINPAQAREHPLQIYVKNNFKNVSKIKSQLTFEECERLVADFDKRKIASTLESMENKKGIQNKYTSVNLTLRKWIDMDFNKTTTTIQGNPPAKITQATLKHIGASVIMKIEKKSGEIIGVQEGKYRVALNQGGEIITAAWSEFIITASAPKRNMAEPTALQSIIKEIRPSK